MPEIYGEYEGDAETQYVACVVCGDLLDLFDPHPMFRDEDVSEVGDVVARTYHFCSDDCRQRWRRERDAGE
ncbi:DUF7576 family protein [Halorussus aquaticus]|uniref:MYM-type Zinc finger with FCS sequence motif-containing protein n=1 Tax=Halorussus aquaticus TaxID=2953748 RepID=A0ABD5Q042_9EURY|nr:hypothetical protein [Halorussus aquaticus]